MLHACHALLSAFLSIASQDAAPAAPQPSTLRFDTPHRIEVGGATLDYHAVAETTLLRDDKGEPEAEFFTFAYLADGVVGAAGAPPRSDRPVTFAFNGGPGSSSIWLHMGLLGPKLAQVPSDAGNAGAPPYPLVANPDSLLAVSDLVMVDPIGTGLSRVVGNGKAADHWGFDEDAKSVARFIRRWLADHGRWASPKYLLGESYGGIRSALLVRELQAGTNAVALNGVILISPALDMELVDGQDNDACYATEIPTFAATAWYHHALPDRPDALEPFLAEACRFVEREYVPALFAGRDFDGAKRDAMARKLHRFTGLSPEYLARANLRVSSDRFRRELLRDRGLVVGRLDTRYTGTEPDAVGEVPSGDPMDAGIGGAFTATFMAYLQGELGVTVDREYQISARGAGASWKRPAHEWDSFQGYVDTTPEIARGMADNPALRVFIASGWYDIATTFFAAEHNVRRSTMDRSRVTLKNYPAGHMMYVHQPTLAALASDLREFVSPAKQ